MTKEKKITTETKVYVYKRAKEIYIRDIRNEDRTLGNTKTDGITCDIVKTGLGGGHHISFIWSHH